MPIPPGSSWDTLCGKTEVRGLSNIYMIGMGYAAHTTYYLATEVPSGTQDLILGSGVTDEFGNIVFSRAPANDDNDFVLHANNVVDKADRVSAQLFLKWGPDFPIPDYNPSVPTLSAMKGDKSAVLTWPASTACDPRMDPPRYQLQRNGSDIPANGAWGTKLGYFDQGLVNGTSYSYRVRARATYLNGLITGPLNGDFASVFSTAVIVIPSPSKESWGMIAA